MPTESKYAIDLEKYPDCIRLVEEASRLIKEGKRPTITFGRGVNFAVRSKQPFKGYRWQLLRLYSDPYYVTGTCLHEAAHGLMKEENAESNIIFCGPGVRFDENGVLFPYAAYVTSDPNPLSPLQATVMQAVGAVAMEKYCGIKEVSDQKDYDDFLRQYNAMPNGFFAEGPKEYWKQAQNVASAWADVPERKTKVFEKASEYLRLLYL
jgi:hypothetical protein